MSVVNIQQGRRICKAQHMHRPLQWSTEAQTIQGGIVEHTHTDTHTHTVLHNIVPHNTIAEGG